MIDHGGAKGGNQGIGHGEIEAKKTGNTRINKKAGPCLRSMERTRTKEENRDPQGGYVKLDN